MSVVIINHATGGHTNYFTLTNNIKSQYEEINEVIDLSNQIDEVEQGGIGYMFDSITKLTRKTFRYHNIETFQFWQINKAFLQFKNYSKHTKRW